MTIKGTLLSGVPIVTDFQSNMFQVRFFWQKSTFWGPKQGLNVTFNFCNPKRHILA